MKIRELELSFSIEGHHIDWVKIRDTGLVNYQGVKTIEDFKGAWQAQRIRQKGGEAKTLNVTWRGY